MRKIFTLRGVGGSGKTTNIKNIAAWIISNYTVINHNIDLSRKDIFGVLEINKLKIGFVSSGDNLSEVLKNDELLKQFPDIDILVNACRTRGTGRRFLHSNYNFATGWLTKNIFVEKYPTKTDPYIATRDLRIHLELQTWLIGLEKL